MKKRSIINYLRNRFFPIFRLPTVNDPEIALQLLAAELLRVSRMKGARGRLRGSLWGTVAFHPHCFELCNFYWLGRVLSRSTCFPVGVRRDKDQEVTFLLSAIFRVKWGKTCTQVCICADCQELILSQGECEGICSLRSSDVFLLHWYTLIQIMLNPYKVNASWPKGFSFLL